MENKTGYKTITKKFLGYDVRMVQVDKRNEYIICKDMFDVLGLVNKDGKWSMPKRKMLEFLEGIDGKEDVQSLDVLVKQNKIKTKEYGINKTSDHQLLVVRVKVMP